MRRIIREEEPPTPSTRLSTLGRDAHDRLGQPARPTRGSSSRSVRGELDWIVMKALEKDRRRRYETANDFAADVMRYLTDQPVEACPPSARYRFAKFLKRNRFDRHPDGRPDAPDGRGTLDRDGGGRRGRDEAPEHRQLRCAILLAW